MDESFWREVERARRMTPDERVSEGFALFEQGRNYITDRIRQTFPDATPDEVDYIRRRVLKRAKEMGVT
jgi:hypothetical protein